MSSGSPWSPPPLPCSHSSPSWCLGSHPVTRPPPFWQCLPPSCRALMSFAAHPGDAAPAPPDTATPRPSGSFLCSGPLFFSVSLMTSRQIFEEKIVREGRSILHFFFNEKKVTKLQNDHKHSVPLRLLAWSLSLSG